MGSPVELHEIRAFLALSKELHFARTADRLGVTPSRVSQTIATLEARLGVRLFERTSRRVTLTPAGAQLAERLAPAYEELLAALEAAKAPAAVAGPLRIGTYSRVVGGPHLVDIMNRFNAEHPACPVVYVDTGPRNYLDVLRSGEVDVLAARLPISDPEFAIGPVLTSEQPVILMSAGHRLAAEETVSVDDLIDEKVADIATFPREMMDAFVPSITSSGERIARVESASWEQILISVAAGQLIHTTVPSFLTSFSHPGVAAVPIADRPPSETALVWLTADRRPNLREFVRTAQTVLDDLGAH